MTTTAGAIIKSTLAKLGLVGAGASVGGNDLGFCHRALNMMCSSMRLGPSFAYTQAETVVTVGAGTSSLTVGAGQQVDIDPPLRFESSSFARVSGVDHPLEVTNDRERYNALSMKTIAGAWPELAFFDGGTPIGRLYLWPQAACELHLVSMSAVGQFADVTTEYTLPDGYEEMFVNCLAVRVAPDYEVTPRPEVVAMARNLARQVKRGNLVVPQLDVHGARVDTQSAFLRG